MPDELCPTCRKPYIKKREFETAIMYDHIPPTSSCQQRVGLPTNPIRLRARRPTYCEEKVANLEGYSSSVTDQELPPALSDC